MRILLSCAAIAFLVSCGESSLEPRPLPQLFGNGSFELDGEPTLAGWEEYALSEYVDFREEGAPDAGNWSLKLTGGWMVQPTVSTHIVNLRGGDIFAVSADLKALPGGASEGGGHLSVSMGPSRDSYRKLKTMGTTEPQWTTLSVVDTVETDQDSVWVTLWVSQCHLCVPEGAFDAVKVTLLSR